MSEERVLQGTVAQDTLPSYSEGVLADLRINKRGELVVCDFYTQMTLEGRAYNVRAGSLSAPATGDATLTDATAEMAAEIVNGYTIIPCYFSLGINVGAGTVHEYALKSVGAATITPNFVPLPLLMGGVASVATAEVDETGATTVTAETDATTRVHYHMDNPVAVGAGHAQTNYEWRPKCPPPLAGVVCFYVQVAASAGPSYFASFDFIELPTAAIS